MNKELKHAIVKVVFLIFVLLELGAGDRKVAAESNKLKVGIVDNALPCSDYEDGNYIGSAVDLWRTVAEMNSIKYDVLRVKNPNNAVKKASNGEIDVAISCLNIISQRLDKVEFSVPYQSDSLAFLSRVKDNTKILYIFSEILNSKIIFTSLLMLYGITLIASILLWRLSKGFKNKDVQCETTLYTFLKGWMMLAIGGGIYKLADNPQNMSIITIVNITRLVMTSVLVGTIASIIFQEKLQEDGSSDLFLKDALENVIGVDKGTISELWIENEAKKQKVGNNKIIPISGDDQLIKALKSEKVGSILGDYQRIILLEKSISEKGKFHISANTFNETPQSFIYGQNMDNKKKKEINISIAKLLFSGKVEEIQARWK